MVLREKLYTVEEFREIARLPENMAKQLELEDGIIVEMASSKPTNTVVAGRIIYFLNNHVILNNLGIITTDGGFRLSADTSRQPDIAYVPMQQVETMLHSEPKGKNDTLDGSEVLPYFRLTVKDIFPTNLKDE